jgi:hypothetical protein
VLCFLGVLFNVVAALLYNLISDVVGGVKITLAADKDTNERSAPPAADPRAPGPP